MVSSYRCIFKEGLLIDEDFDIMIQLNQVVQIQRTDTPCGWPIVFINNEEYDMAIEEEDFDSFFERFHKLIT